MQKHLSIRQRQRWQRKLNSLSILSWRPHRAVVHLREPENGYPVVVQCVVEFLTHVDHVGYAFGHQLIDVGLTGNFSADGDALGHKIERYGHADYPEPHSLTSTVAQERNSRSVCRLDSFPRVFLLRAILSQVQLSYRALWPTLGNIWKIAWRASTRVGNGHALSAGAVTHSYAVADRTVKTRALAYNFLFRAVVRTK